ncbi:MAG: YihA family ribosome biogenesis GTP-binding protein [Alphaproteobacteria bacterium]|nr:YihA family ribosome biogenesis GTP-binding protein [Alphaproteobacteria bacterium]
MKGGDCCVTEIPEKDAVEKGRKLFAQPCDFVLAAAAAAQFPPGKMPEIAFIGRSNVGKSSLINALVGRKNLARASNTPGRTQQIVFFNLGQRLMLADLPGYGYAKTPLEEKARWMDLVESYLMNRPQLKCICLLFDGRHGAKDNDVDMMRFLDRAGVIYQIVLTKIDQARKGDADIHARAAAELAAQHPAARSDILRISAEKHQGFEELRALLAGFALPA